MKGKNKKKIRFVIDVLAVLFIIIQASVLYKLELTMVANIFSLVSGSLLSKMIIENPEASLYFKFKKKLDKIAVLYKKTFEEILTHYEILLVIVLAIFIFLISFSPLSGIVQWFMVVIFSMFIFVFYHIVKTLK